MYMRCNNCGINVSLNSNEKLKEGSLGLIVDNKIFCIKCNECDDFLDIKVKKEKKEKDNIEKDKSVESKIRCVCGGLMSKERCNKCGRVNILMLRGKRGKKRR